MSENFPGDPDEIQRALIKLHDELAKTRSLDENERAMLRHLMDDIQSALQKPASTDVDNQNLVDRLEQSVEMFDVSHPTLSAVIRKALETLNIAGI